MGKGILKGKVKARVNSPSLRYGNFCSVPYLTLTRSLTLYLATLKEMLSINAGFLIVEVNIQVSAGTFEI
ncbi:hypothetical protein RJT34_22493 [Clitoria ternatea]|uniref:Uncharacterized protein n=1 Tax=Clitoria ternatea TaxID=43366 RepID=A0AAN9IHJ2_CLITE